MDLQFYRIYVNFLFVQGSSEILKEQGTMQVLQVPNLFERLSITGEL
jgi:hypothetical protein